MSDKEPETGSKGQAPGNSNLPTKPAAKDPDESHAAEISTAVLPGDGAPPPLEVAPLAYENPTFLNSSDGRLILIVAEYMEPLARFRHEHIQDTVVFFGSARFRGREEADHALELLDNTGSCQAAPSEEQPATVPDIAAGKATNLQRKRLWLRLKWRATMKTRGACRTCLR